ncbi:MULTISPECIES: AraC family transcriptional regulator [unclassified Parabacteroides]|uniref:helix-turn-helix transcriptional regulator n=1 Tax=unclassified Parabacteroides TaxID=2649774 RepID=UPI0024766769|nr:MULTISPECIES: AraC family transcriptional regulator [unclassified Parabacteroides]
MKEDTLWSALSKDYNHLLFFLEGKANINCNEFINQNICESEFVLVPISADFKCRVLTQCRVVEFSFENLFDIDDNEYVQKLLKLTDRVSHSFAPLSFREPMGKFFDHLLCYILQLVEKPILNEIKHKELQILLQALFSVEELVSLLHPVIGKTSSFRNQVLRNYRQISKIDELSDILGSEKRSFSRKFKEEFNQSPYQWLLNQKAKHVRFSLADAEKSLEDIRKEHGFKFAGHFTRFCKEQFDTTPMKLRRQLTYSK